MKIQFLAYYHTNLKDLLRELSKDHDVSLLLKKDYSSLDGEKFSYTKVKSYNLFNNKVFGSYYSLTSLLKNIDDDTDFVIIKHINKPDSILAFIACYIKNVNFVIYVQWVKHLRSKFYKFFFQLLTYFLKADDRKIFAVVRQGCKELKEIFRNVEYIPLPIDEKKFEKKKYHSKKDKMDILMVGRLDTQYKNHNLLIDALERIYEKYGDLFNLTLIGHADRKNKYYKELTKKINRRKINITVEHNLSYSEMKRTYKDHDLFVFPSSSDTVGYALLEAMASGLPVICCKESGAESYISEGENGYLFKIREDHGLEQKIEKFINGGKIDWDKIERFGKKSLEIVRDNHDPSENAKKLIFFVSGGE